ncbi:hypothetical protein PHLCEN_2v4902 [Hermanssonia centrifuga]|uniref:Uncharacterized protein n=1 Tax=Hermanssonia centrifuga TaxID=98765 RepID=A0A2R6PG08_9APHY|nr:hypothetical protein PHLCEN_2v4902 [Hermanssonia centrifuga]
MEARALPDNQTYLRRRVKIMPLVVSVPCIVRLRNRQHRQNLKGQVERAPFKLQRFQDWQRVSPEDYAEWQRKNPEMSSDSDDESGDASDEGHTSQRSGLSEWSS